MVHGGHAIPLYYYPGFRSAWYLIKKGERLNELGDISPFPQAFIFISGKGFAKIGEKTMRVRAGEAYYIPPGSEHVVWTEGDNSLELIYLAWGEGA
jgi:mannose-6-phosphate isomerase-like protein (cupin superfamily)